MRTLALTVAVLLLTSFANARPAGQGATVRTLVIDPGHGGMDPGAIGPGNHHEADLALAVSLKFGKMVQENFPDVKIIYTRTTDKFVSLADRAEIANKAKADLFICIHLNSATNHEAYGTSTYVLGLHRTEDNLDIAKRENSVVELENDKDRSKNYEFDPNSPEGHIIMSMKQNAFLDQSILIASKIEDELAAAAKRKSRGVKQAGFWVLYKTAMPALLAEIGFISNPTEEKFLSSDSGQTSIATSILKAFRGYKNDIEGTPAGASIVKPMPEEVKKEMETTKTVTTKEEVVVQNTVSNEPKVEMKKAEPETQVVQTTVKTEIIPEKPVEKVVEKQAEKQPETAPTRMVERTEPVKPAAHDKEPAGGWAWSPEGEVKREEPAKVKVDPAKIPAETKAQPVTVKTTTTTATVKTEKPKVPLNSNEAPVKPVAEKAPEKPAAKPAEKPAEKPVVKTEVKTVTKETKVVEKTTTVKTPAASAVTVFRLQLVAAHNRPHNMKQLEAAFPAIIEEDAGNGVTRYMAGDFETYNKAKQMIAKAEAMGFKGAFVIAYQNGKRTDTKRTLELAK
ncbi:MAG: N-acetylmuramoyl-L-alanine amidase [Chitinophagales bacterium]